MLEINLKESTKDDPKFIWPIFWKRFIDDEFGIIKGSKSDVEYFIKKINSLVKTIEIDKFDFGTKVNSLDITIYKGTRFSKKGIFDIKLYQKYFNIAYIPLKSDHPSHIIVNFTLVE